MHQLRSHAVLFLLALPSFAAALVNAPASVRLGLRSDANRPFPLRHVGPAVYGQRAWHSAQHLPLNTGTSFTDPRAQSPIACIEPAAAASDLAGEVDEKVEALVSHGGHGDVSLPGWLLHLSELQDRGLGSLVLILATIVSLSLANAGRTSAAWLGLWATPIGPAIGHHKLTVRAWINEALMAVFFFLVGLEIKQELRLGSLATVRTAVLPCIAAVGGMLTPMLVYVIAQTLLPAGSMLGVTIPMATDIAFAMAIFGFFRNRMPASASAFLLTLATVDDLGAILVLATCFAQGLAPPFLAAAAAIVAAMTALGRSKCNDLKIYSAGGISLWYCLLRAGVNADVAGVLAALCLSTKATMQTAAGKIESVAQRAIGRLVPLSAFFIMPLFALANTAVKLGAAANAGATSATPAIGIGAGLLLGKPLGIFGFTWLAVRCGMCSMPSGMSNKHLGIVGLLGGIGFTMCLLLTEVALPSSVQALPKLVILSASALSSVLGALAMRSMPLVEEPKPGVA